VVFANNYIFKPLLLNSRTQWVSGKNEQPTQTPCRGAQCSSIGLRPALQVRTQYHDKTELLDELMQETYSIGGYLAISNRFLSLCSFGRLR